MYKRFFTFALVLCPASLNARQEPVLCGTDIERSRLERQLHKVFSQRAAAARLNKSETRTAEAARPDVGNIAVLSDTEGVVARRNPFNLDGRTLRFTASGATASSYRYELTDAGYDATAAAAGTTLTGIGDDDSREIQIPFSFPFYGRRYSSLFVNSDGNLTFTEKDAAITDRSLGRVTAGAPRIAALFRDLDPARATGTGISVTPASDRVVISWTGVPEYRDTGTGLLQTFQVRLFPSGTIELAWAGASTSDAVVGIAPGRLEGASSVVSFLTGVSGEYSAAVAERFTGTEEIDMFTAAQRFYLNHEDSYDYLVAFNTLGVGAGNGVVAYEVTVRNSRSGYGDEQVENGRETGSGRRLQALLNMGQIGQYPLDPNARLPARSSVGDTTLSTIAHETGHLFLAYASVRDENGGRPMLGSQNAHWAFTFNSEASLLEGNRIQDNGPNASPRFQTVATVEGYAPLDQYLMGLRSPEEVPDTFYVANPRQGITSGLPRVGATFNGDRRNVSVADLIQAEGRRTPDSTVAQRRFRFAFILITPNGQPPSAEDVQRIDAYRTAFEAYFNRATSGRATADTSLRRSLSISTWPAAGVIENAAGSGSITLERPAETALTVLLRSQTGVVGVPAAVTIPAGGTQAVFEMRGLRAGTDELTAEASDPRFETTVSRIAVLPSASVRMSVVSGDGQVVRPGASLTLPVTIRITDDNKLPYPGVQLCVADAGSGAVSPASATTDAGGIATFVWRPGTDAVHELRVSRSDGTGVTVTALDRPVVSTGSVVNAASFASGLVPGGIGTFFGSSLGASTGTQVLISGQPAQVLYSSTRQVNFVTPPDLQPGTAQLLVRTPAGDSLPISAAVLPVQPGIFFNAATGYGAVIPTGDSRVFEVYCTGLGSVTASPDGLRRTIITPQVQVAGVPAEVLYSGLAPGFTGLYQINMRVGAGTPSGTQTLSVSADGQRSNEVKIEIR